MIKIIIVDDENLVRMGIKSLISSQEGLKIIGEASNGDDAIKLCRTLKPDIVLMDLKMPGIGGLEAIRRIVKLCNNIRVVALTIYGEEPMPSRVLQAGAMGYITKGSSLDEMLEAIKSVFRGKKYICPKVAQKLALKHINAEDGSVLDLLSDREMQIMMMIIHGDKVQDISDRLCLSPKTVNSYRYRVFDKLKINSDVELTHIALRHGLLESM